MQQREEQQQTASAAEVDEVQSQNLTIRQSTQQPLPERQHEEEEAPDTPMSRQMIEHCVSEKAREEAEATPASAENKEDEAPVSNTLTKWPELPKKRARRLSERVAEMEDYSKDLRAYVKEVQAFAVPFALVDTLLDRATSYMGTAYKMLVENIDGRTAAMGNMKVDLKEPVTRVALDEFNTAVGIAMNRLLAGDMEECEKMKKKVSNCPDW